MMYAINDFNNLSFYYFQEIGNNDEDYTNGYIVVEENGAIEYVPIYDVE